MHTPNTLRNDYLKLVFNNDNIANIGDATGLRGSSAAGSLYVGLHTIWPGLAGDQTSNEATYTGYARKAVARTTGGFTVSSSQVTNTAAVTFDACTGGSNTIQFFSVGVAASGASKAIIAAPLGSALGPCVGENSNDQVTIKGHGLSVSDRVCFFAPTGVTLPGGITEGTVYFVKTAPDSDNITISTTDGGATLDITTDGDAFAFKVVPLSVSNGITPSFAIGALAGNWN